jgi:hypothetical protein
MKEMASQDDVIKNIKIKSALNRSRERADTNVK